MQHNGTIFDVRDRFWSCCGDGASVLVSEDNRRRRRHLFLPVWEQQWEDWPSFLIHGQLEKRDDTVRRETLFNLENHGISRASSAGGDLSNVGGLLTMAGSLPGLGRNAYGRLKASRRS